MRMEKVNIYNIELKLKLLSAKYFSAPSGQIRACEDIFDCTQSQEYKTDTFRQ